MSSHRRRQPGWKRLWRHSYVLGVRWVFREARHGWPARKVGLARLLVPLDPWRYYELGRVAEEVFAGTCLDVSSPKLLPSLLHREGQGRWVSVDLFEREVEAWRTIDPDLELDVQDATALSFADQTFDHCLCVSVLEHIGLGRDAVALSEIRRVLKPGGVLHMTTDVADESRDTYLGEKIYGEASPTAGESGVFFKHDYTVAELESLVERGGWHVVHREFAAQRRPGIEDWFYRRAPLSYVAGPFLRLVCPGNVEVSTSPALIARRGHGVVYLRLRKPTAAASR